MIPSDDAVPQNTPVNAWSSPVQIPTYSPLPADRNPMFFERRVYQGSSGKVYPLPFYDRISERREDKSWDAVHIENEFLRLMVLPQLGGRIHIAQDKTNGYDFIYRQDVIKPALVGLAGPWISGGIEFNWPQHHRPGTFMPCDYTIENGSDGSMTIWLSDHEPMSRMKGMHGVCLRPGKSYIELKVRLYNRTPFTQTFLWWANVATRVHERYQSFFPLDAFYVADHAKRAMTRFPLCPDRYYGVDYGKRGREGTPPDELPRQFVPPSGEYAPNDLGWYANIPVPTSYMCMGSEEDFFGGYDHAAEAGIVHFASHHVSPGKKQWTWGNHEFGYAWDRNLTNAGADGVHHPYIELMAGVFTDNQPDFSYLAPGETRTFSQYWYPIQKIGPAQKANLDAAVSLRVDQPARSIRAGVATTSSREAVNVAIECKGYVIAQWRQRIEPDAPLLRETQLPDGAAESDLRIVVTSESGDELIRYQPAPIKQRKVPPAATEPPTPAEIESSDELYVTGLHLEQYRHATRHPEDYWQEALKRDPHDSRCNTAMGRWHLRRGEFENAVVHFDRAIQRLTLRNPNPSDGEAFHYRGLALIYLEKWDEAYKSLYKATWSAAWQAPAFHLIAHIDCRRHDWNSALEHLNQSLRSNSENLRARNLKAIVLRKLARPNEAATLLDETLPIDPLDWWAAHLHGRELTCDSQVRLDLALDYANAGFYTEAIELLLGAAAEKDGGTSPLIEYYSGYFHQKSGNIAEALHHYRLGAAAASDYCFPSRLEEILILTAAINANPQDARAPYYLGNLLFDRRRQMDAIALWEEARKKDPKFPTAWRNLGIAYFNVMHSPQKASDAYDKAFDADPADGRIFYERDQLAKRTGANPQARLAQLSQRLDLVGQRDDLSIELCSLYNQTGRHQAALKILTSRHFQPWEGGEGLTLGQHLRTHLAIGCKLLAAGDPARAREHFKKALTSPQNLGEAKHLLANQSDVHYWLGVTADAEGDHDAARKHWNKAADSQGDFQEMSVRPFSEMTFYSALAAHRLGQTERSRRLLLDLRAYSNSLMETEAKIDYFATSLPAMLLFEDDIQLRRKISAMVMSAQADLGLGQAGEARKVLAEVLKLDANNAVAADLLANLGAYEFAEPTNVP